MRIKRLFAPLLGAAARAEPAAPSGSGLAAPAVYAQSRQVWLAARGKVQGELGKLEAAIVAAYQGQPASGEVARAVRKFDRLLTVFDESLAVQIESLMKADDGAERQRLHAEARKTIETYRQALAGEALLRELDDNPFVPVAVQSTLASTLGMLTARIT